MFLTDLIYSIQCILFLRIGQLSYRYLYSCSNYSCHYHHGSGISTVNFKSSVLMILTFTNTGNGQSGQKEYQRVALAGSMFIHLQQNSLVSSSTLVYKILRKVHRLSNNKPRQGTTFSPMRHLIVGFPSNVATSRLYRSHSAMMSNMKPSHPPPTSVAHQIP